MFQYKEPQFEKKRLLRIEMLELLKDYPRDYLKICYQGYCDGVLSGCRLSWDNGQITIAPGILYHGEHLYFMRQPCTVECEAEDKVRYLKVQFLAEVQESGVVEGNTRIILNDQAPDSSCELELCRFRLQEGARLRDTHESFEDFATKFDTINLIYAPFADESEPTINPLIMKQYAKEILESRSGDTYDAAFAMNVLSNRGMVPAECISAYVKVKTGRDAKGNETIYQCLGEILRMQRNGEVSRAGTGRNQREILLL